MTRLLENDLHGRMVSWLLNHRQIWRAGLLVLLGLAIFAPWGYTYDGVPPPEWCDPPFILLDDGRCVDVIQGNELLSLFLVAWPALLTNFFRGEFPLRELGREFLVLLAFTCFLFPFVTGLLLLIKDSHRRQIAHMVILGATVCIGLLILRPDPANNPIFLGGFWLYFIVAGLALVLELILRFSGVRWEKLQSVNQ